eukprot:scaffold24751_cov13-Tisochrysis_lutea.AAC.2
MGVGRKPLLLVEKEHGQRGWAVIGAWGWGLAGRATVVGKKKWAIGMGSSGIKKRMSFWLWKMDGVLPLQEKGWQRQGQQGYKDECFRSRGENGIKMAKMDGMGKRAVGCARER